MSKEKVKQYVFLTILMSVINFCVAGVLIGTTVINLKGADSAVKSANSCHRSGNGKANRKTNGNSGERNIKRAYRSIRRK